LRWLRQIARKGFVVCAIDCVHEMVELTGAMTRRAGVASQVFAQVGDIENVPFADATFEQEF
jgi:Methyltransferase domain